MRNTGGWLGALFQRRHQLEQRFFCAHSRVLDEQTAGQLVLKAGRVVEHRSIAPIPGAAASQLELRLASPVPDLGAKLSAVAGLSHIEVDGERVRCRFAGDPAARHQLLRQLLELGLPICGLSEVTTDMQASYLASVGASNQRAHR